ncbi:hypothetical protein HS088_TW05G00244 [Tripterygium wilfordii]|uniref:Uncharacterized protein n=1 Tax=Tripterygium wilfordii TaxID=458696 RepID=A0A7J7DMC0_TRIWF|nr:hypothetical protein HS088_TW05G00244 [Tripterygium wilfordii]
MTKNLMKTRLKNATLPKMIEIHMEIISAIDDRAKKGKSTEQEKEDTSFNYLFKVSNRYYFEEYEREDYGEYQPPSSSRSTSQSINESQSTDEFGLALSNSTNARGTAKGIKKWGTGVQIKVDFDDKFQPVGKNAAALKGQLGQIVGNGRKFSLTYADWPAVSDNVKEDIWNEVKDNLVDVPDGYKEACLQSCNMLWKDRKSKLKRKWFTPHMDEPDLSSKVPKNIVLEQWRELVEYFRSDYAYEVAARNASSREMRGSTHTTGRTHFAQIRDRVFEIKSSTN